jgi:general secretion pathway protein J
MYCKKRKLRTKAQGFTLIEILIALSIFAIIASITGPFLKQMITAREGINANALQITQLQKTLFLIRNDLQQAVQDPRGNKYFIGSEAHLEFTRLGAYPINYQSKTHLEKVDYQIINNQLIRQTENGKQILIEKIHGGQFSYLNNENSMVTAWSMEEHQTPRAVNIHLDLALGKIDSLIMLKSNS